MFDDTQEHALFRKLYDGKTGQLPMWWLDTTGYNGSYERLRVYAPVHVLVIARKDLAFSTDERELAELPTIKHAEHK